MPEWHLKREKRGLLSFVIFRSLPFSGRESNPSSYYYVGFFFLSLSLLLNGNFDTARGGKESTEAQARNRLQIISLDTAGLCNPHGRDFYLFIFFSFQLHRGFPPPLFHFPPAWLLSYSNVSHARNPRGGASWQQIQHGKEEKTKKRRKKMEEKQVVTERVYTQWKELPLLLSKTVIQHAWLAASSSLFFILFFLFETIACSSRARQIQLQQYIDDGFFFSGCVVYFTAGIPQTRSSEHSMKNKQTWTEFSPRSWKLWQSSYR
jgi:hypothetical protein